MPFPYETQTTKKWGFMSMKSTRARKSHPPVRTLDELAEVFGVSKATLQSYMQHNPGAPARAATGGRKAHYPLHDMLAWWNAVILPKRVLSHSLLAGDN
jgi:hypothetical protein